MEKSRARLQSGGSECSSICFRAENSLLQKPCVSVDCGTQSESLTSSRAYEIKFMHGQEPPPVSILENLTAKGGDTRTRTVENFQAPLRTGYANGGSDSEPDGSRTPKEEKMDTDDPGSGGGRQTRGESAFALLAMLQLLTTTSQAFVKPLPLDSYFNQIYRHLDRPATHLAISSLLNQHLLSTLVIIILHLLTPTAQCLQFKITSLHLGWLSRYGL